MNVKAFKQLIKESVAEAVREELQAILIDKSSKQMNENQSFNFSSNDVSQIGDVRNQLRSKMGNMFGFEQNTFDSNNLKLEENDKNPYINFIMDAAKNMTPQDKAGLSNLN
jgi:uncharacterized membrane protein YfhO